MYALKMKVRFNNFFTNYDYSENFTLLNFRIFIFNSFENLTEIIVYF